MDDRGRLHAGPGRKIFFRRQREGLTSVTDRFGYRYTNSHRAGSRAAHLCPPPSCDSDKRRIGRATNSNATNSGDSLLYSFVAFPIRCHSARISPVDWARFYTPTESLSLTSESQSTFGVPFRRGLGLIELVNMKAAKRKPK